MPIHISGYLYEWKAAIRILKLYIIPEHNQADKKRNVETLNLANAIKVRRFWKYIIKLTDLIITDCPI